VVFELLLNFLHRFFLLRCFPVGHLRFFLVDFVEETLGERRVSSAKGLITGISSTGRTKGSVTITISGSRSGTISG
jgi:hypothetical protein